MAKIQTRRSISIRGITYQRLKDFCDDEERSVSGWLEDMIADKLDAAKVPVPTILRPRPKKEMVKAADLPNFFHSGITTL